MAWMRSSSKNMCSVRQRPMPSAPKERAARASGGVSALARTRHAPALVGPAHERAEIAGKFRLHHRHGAGQHLAGRAVDGDDVALPEDAAGNAELAGGVVDAHAAGARHARNAHAAGNDGGMAGHAAARGQDAFGRMHAVDIFRAGLDAHQDDLATERLQRFGIFGGEHDLAGRRPRRSRQAGADDIAAGVGRDGRMQQLVERGRIDARHRLVASRSAPPATMSTAMFSAALAVRFPARVCSIHSLPRSMVNSRSCMSR